MLGHLEFANRFSDPKPDLLLALETPFFARCSEDDLFEFSFRCHEQLFSFSRPLTRKQRVVADDQALARVVRMGDFGHVAGIKKRGLKAAALDQFADLRGSQRGNPVQPFVAFNVLTDTSLSDHPSITHKDHALNAKALTDFNDLAVDRRRIGAVAIEDLDCNRTPIRGTQKPYHDLELYAPSISRLCPRCAKGHVRPSK